MNNMKLNQVSTLLAIQRIDIVTKVAFFIVFGMEMVFKVPFYKLIDRFNFNRAFKYC